MKNVIIVYADCVNPTALGDFSLAGNLAKDLIGAVNKPNVGVVLSSSRNDIARYERLYGPAKSGYISIGDTSIQLRALEDIDPVQMSVIAFVEANRCKYPAAEVLRRVLSPDAKLISIGAANQPVLNVEQQNLCFNHLYPMEQPGLFCGIDRNDFMRVACGVGDGRIGLPRMLSLSEMSSNNHFTPTTQLHSQPYGFMYLSDQKPIKTLQLMLQYIELTAMISYQLVGQFKDSQQHLTRILSQNRSQEQQNLYPNIAITVHPSLSNIEMRSAVVGASTKLVATTGVMSTIEAMLEKKLPFYQDVDCNDDFIASWLLAVNDYCCSGDLVVGAEAVMELAQLLFAAKPLDQQQLKRTKVLLALDTISTALTQTNSALISRANGTVSSVILGFLGNPCSITQQKQCAEVCFSLKKSAEQLPPVLAVALRRSAAWGKIFEMKVLLARIEPDALNQVDNSMKRTALHWALHGQHRDAARLLLAAGAKSDIADTKGMTACHLVQNSLAKTSEDQISLDTAIRRAAAGNKVLELEILLKNASLDTVNQQDTGLHQRTALHWAVLHKHQHCVDLLLQHGARIDVEDAHQETAVAIASRLGMVVMKQTNHSNLRIS